MKIINTRKKLNYINYKVGGLVFKKIIKAGEEVDIPEITDFSQIINSLDFKTGFFKVIDGLNKGGEAPVELSKEEEEKEEEELTKASEGEGDEEDSLDKAEKEVEDYTDGGQE